MNARATRIMLAIGLVLIVVAGFTVMRSIAAPGRIELAAYFDNSTGIYAGDDVVILGVKVGEVEHIEAQPLRTKISFWVDERHQIPADAKAVILSPKLITSRAIQLTPAYTSGPAMATGTVIPQDRTAVPMEWDDFRNQLQKLAGSLEPSQPDGSSPLGAFVTTAAENLRGQGQRIRTMIINLSQTVSALGDHSEDIFSTVRNISRLVSALHDSAELMSTLNTNLATASGLLANDPNEVGQAIADLDTVVDQVTGFVADNKEALGTLSQKSASVSQAIVESLADVKQALHVLPNVAQNVANIYDPAHGSLTGVLQLPNFANPINFLCGAIQAASRLGGEQSAKLCVQYLAPIIKNRQYNFLPLGLNPVVNTKVRPNEVTYSEDRLRPDHVPAATSAPPPPAADPAAGLPGLMMPPEGG